MSVIVKPEFEIDGVKHATGGPDCEDCWAGYPRQCECGGWIHAVFGDENTDCEYWLYRACDSCNDPTDADAR